MVLDAWDTKDLFASVRVITGSMLAGAHHKEAKIGRRQRNRRVNAEEQTHLKGLAQGNGEHAAPEAERVDDQTAEHRTDQDHREAQPGELVYFLPVAALRRSNSLSEHHGIVHAVRRRDEGHARNLVRAHVADTHDDAPGRWQTAPNPRGRSASPAPDRHSERNSDGRWTEPRQPIL
ncbi:MAG TPA: hypothetical protein VE645_00030 [Pseudonocardiaceae bacterium]|jgi:hypothetical protein|nr:hypothetical protein [Pseudonocardiaceae bacterium]